MPTRSNRGRGTTLHRNALGWSRAALLLAFPACASIVSPTESPLRVACNVEGATVRVLDVESQPVFEGAAPCDVVVDHGAGFFRGATYTVLVSCRGFRDEAVTVGTTLNEWYLGNAFIPGGLIGSVLIDPFTGAMFELETQEVRVELDPLDR